MNTPARLLFVSIAFAMTSAGRTEPANKWWAKEKGIREGQLIKGSESPDHKLALFEFNVWDGDAPTTATGIGLAPVDRSRLLYVIDSRTKWMTDKEVTSFLKFLWNGESTFMATHDSGSRHSRLHLYRLKEGEAEELKMPDLLTMACGKLGIPLKSVASSGQMPERWLRDDLLEVDVRVVTSKGKLSAKVPLLIDQQGAVKTQ